MKKQLLAAIMIAAFSVPALAQTPKPTEDSLSGKAMRDQPGNNGGGTTSNPTGKPDESSLSGKAMRDQPGNNGAGTTTQPGSKPDESSLSGKAMQDLPGNK